MSRLPYSLPRFTLDQYLAYSEDHEPDKYEYLDGMIFAIEAATPNHATIAANVAGVIRNQLSGTNCRPFDASVIVVVPEDFGAMPDFAVACGEPEIYQGKKGPALLNPTLIVEIASPSTADYDIGEKFRRYRQIASLIDYLFVEQNEICVEHWNRNPKGKWSKTVYTNIEEIIEIKSIKATLALKDIYEWIEFTSG